MKEPFDRIGLGYRISYLLAPVIAATAVYFVFIHDFTPSIDEQGGIVLVFEVEAGGVDARDRALEVMRNRVDEMDFAVASVHPQGENRIRVELPGASDPARVKRMLMRSAKLEFRLVDDKSGLVRGLSDQLPEGIRMETYTYYGPRDEDVTEAYLVAAGSGEEGRRRLLGFIEGLQVPPGREIVLARKVTPDGAEYRTYYLHANAALTGENLDDASVRIDPEMGTPQVSIQFDRTGARLFEEFTAAHVRERLAIIMDGEVSSAPVIASRIAGGSALITLGAHSSFDELRREAYDLAAVLRSGAMPAPIRIVEERVVPPPAE